MIKLIFNRFVDGDGVTQDINTNVNVKVTETGAKQTADNIEKVADSTAKPINKVQELKDKINQLPDAVKTLREAWSDTMKSMKSDAKKGTDSLGILEKGFKSLSVVRLTYLFRTIKRGVSLMVDTVENAANYEESLNLFTMALGRYKDMATQWQTRITDALKLDPAEVMKYTGALFNLTKGMNVSSKAAYIMGTNLTQLTYDMASYLNISNDAAFAKIQSAMAGQSRAVASVGVATQMASLQELALSLGIKKSVSEMTQAEKTYLRYIQLMKSTQQMQGDLGRTMITPANAIRTLKNQINLLSRSIGQVMTPIIMKAIPYIMALTNVLTRAAAALAKFFGYKVADVDYSTAFSFEDAKDGADNIGALGDAVKKAGKDAKNSLAPFDNLNQIMNETATAGGSGGSGGGGGIVGTDNWDSLLPQYDMLAEYTDEFVAKAKDLEGTVSKIAVILGGLVAANIIGNTIIKLANLKNAIQTLTGKELTLFGDSFKLADTKAGSLLQTIGKIGKALAGLYISKKSTDLLIDKAENDESGETDLLDDVLGAGVVGGGALAGWAVGGPIGGIVGALGGVVWALEEAHERQKTLNGLFADGYGEIKHNVEEVDNFNSGIKKSVESIKKQRDSQLKQLDASTQYWNRLKSITDETGKIKQGYEDEAQVLAKQLNVALGTNVKIQDGQIKNYSTISSQIDKLIQKKRAEIELNALEQIYTETILKQKLALENLTKAEDQLKKAKENVENQSGKTREQIKREQEQYEAAQKAYSDAFENYKEIIVNKEQYEKAYREFLKGNYDEIEKIINSSNDKQLKMVKDNLVKQTNEVENGEISQELLSAWAALGRKDKDAVNEGLKQIADEETRNKVLTAIALMGPGISADGYVAGYGYVTNFTGSAQKGFDENHLKPTVDNPSPWNINNVYNSVQEKFNMCPITPTVDGNSFATKLQTDVQKRFKNNPIEIKGKVTYKEEMGKSGPMTVKIGGYATGGFPTSGDLFFANENGRAEFISSIGNRTVVANQDQMVQAVSNAIIAGFNKFNGGGSATQPITINLGNETLWKGKVNHDKQQLDRYGSSSVIQV